MDIKEFVERELAKDYSNTVVLYDTSAAGYNNTVYVPSKKDITGTVNIKNEYNVGYTAVLTLDNPAQKNCFAGDEVPKITLTEAGKFQFTFQFKAIADAGGTEDNTDGKGAMVPVTVKLIKKEGGALFAEKRFTIRCNTPPKAPTIAYDNDIFTITRSGDAIHQDIVSADCVITVRSFTWNKTLSLTDGTAGVTVKDIALEKHIDKLKNANGTRTIQVTAIDKAGLRSKNTGTKDGEHTYRTNVDFGCELDGTPLTFDSVSFAASIDTSELNAILKVTALSDGASFIYTDTAYTTTGVEFPVDLSTKTQQKFTFKVIAEDGAASRDYTVTVNKVNEVEISATDEKPWKKLKDAVADVAKPNVITINGTVTATNAPGNKGDIIIDRDITIIGKADTGTDTLDAAQLNRIFKVQAGKTLTIQNLTLTGGKTTGSENGGGIYTEGTVTLDNCTIENCTTTGNGGGIYAKTTSNVTNVIKGSKIQQNSAVLGGGIYIEADTGVHCTVSAENSDITGNHGSTSGGGVYIAENGAFSIDGGSVAQNTGNSPGKGVYVAGESSGLQYTQGGSFSIKNAATIGLWNNNGNLTDDNDVYLGWNSDASSSVRIIAENLSAAKVARITPENNAYSAKSLVVYMEGSQKASDVQDKFTVTPDGTQEYCVQAANYDDGSGTSISDKVLVLKQVISGSEQLAWKNLKDAVEAATDGDTIFINGTIKATHDPENWGDIIIDKNLTVKGKTGKDSDKLDAAGFSRIFNVQAGKTLTIDGLTLTNGKIADFGGGIYCKKGTLTLEKCTIQNCASVTFGGNKAEGGGIYTDESTLTMTDCTIEGCKAYNTGNEEGSGGGIRGSNTTIELTNCTIKNCLAQCDGGNAEGGGIYNEARKNTTLSKCTISECSATGKNKGRGGAIFIYKNRAGHVSDRLLKLSNCIVEKCTVSGSDDYDVGGISCEYLTLIKTDIKGCKGLSVYVPGRNNKVEFIDSKIYDSTEADTTGKKYCGVLIGTGDGFGTDDTTLLISGTSKIGSDSGKEKLYVCVSGNFKVKGKIIVGNNIPDSISATVVPITGDGNEKYDNSGYVLFKKPNNASLTEGDIGKFKLGDPNYKITTEGKVVLKN